MEKNTNQNVDSLTAGFGISASVAVIFNTLLAMAKESSPTLLAWMTGITSHHWITHGLLVLAVFLILGLILSQRKIQIKTTTLTWTIILSSVFSGLGIVIFFLVA